MTGDMIPIAQNRLHHGYLQVRLKTVSGKIKHRMSSRMVAETWIRKPLPREQINHKNGIRNDNRIINLEWVTAKENIRHAIDVLRAPHPNRIISIEQARDVKKLSLNGMLPAEIKKITGISHNIIWAIRLGRTWKHA